MYYFQAKLPRPQLLRATLRLPHRLRSAFRRMGTQPSRTLPSATTWRTTARSSRGSVAEPIASLQPCTMGMEAG